MGNICLIALGRRSSLPGRDKKIRIGINGSRGVALLIIKNLLLQDNNNAELVAINETSISMELIPFLFNHLLAGDQQHVFEVKNENTLQFGQKSVTVLAVRNPAEIPWAKVGVDYVVEATGSFTEMVKAAAHLKGGAKKVIVTDISKDVPMYVFGVNEKEYKPEDDIVSSAGLITHQLVPILEVLHERFGMVEAVIKIHDSAIATQYIDGPSTIENMDRRPAFFNPVPIFTSGAKAVQKILQVLNGSFGIGGRLMSTLNTFFAITDAVNAVGEFLQKLRDSLGINGPMITLLRVPSARAALNMLDGPCGASSTGIIPADIDAVGKVLTYLSDKLTGTVSHGPTRDRSIVVLTVRLELEATLEDIKAAIKKKSEGKFKGILGYAEDDLSRDGDTRSSIFNAMPTACSALNNNHFKFIFDCDNQWGYGCRVIDLIRHMDSVQP